MMPPMPHDDAAQDQVQTIDLIKQALMKVIDDMTALESDRHLPDGHPMKKVAVSVEAAPSALKGEESPDADMSGTSSDESDPAMLDSLMGDASKADDSGAMPDEQDDSMGLPPEVMDAVKKKKAMQNASVV